MIFAFVTAVLFLAVIAVGIVLFVRAQVNKKKRTGKRGAPAGLSLSLVAAAALLLIMLPGSFHTVEAGEIAVVKRLGVIVKTETSGTYFDFWLTRSYEKYDAKVQQLEINTSAYTSDAQPMDISMTVQFQIRQDNVQRCV